jgi:phosphocarrier protein HPr
LAATVPELNVRLEQEFTVTNKLGIHARVAAQIVKVASSYDAEVWLSRGGSCVNGKNILEIMTLQCPHGSTVRIGAKGRDAGQALQALADLFQGKFGES